jgi:hypothetical protein
MNPNNPLYKSLEDAYFEGGKDYQYGGYIPPVIFSTPLPPTPSPTPSITPTISNTPTQTKTPTPTPTPTQPPINVVFLGCSAQTTTNTTYTFNNFDIVQPGLLVMSITGIDTDGSGFTPTLTIEGNTLTNIRARRSSVSGNFVFLFYYRVVSGTDVDIQVDFGSSQDQVLLCVHRIDGLTIDTPLQTQGNGVLGTDLTLTFGNLPSDAVGVMSHTAMYDLVGYTGATESYDVLVNSTYGSGASFKTTTSGDRPVSVEITTSGLGNQMIGAVWANTIPPTPTPTPSPTSSPGSSPTPTPSITPSVSVSPTQTPSNTPTQTPTISVSPTKTPTPTPTASPGSTPPPTPSVSPTSTITPSPTRTPTPTPSCEGCDRKYTIFNESYTLTGTYGYTKTNCQQITNQSIAPRATQNVFVRLYCACVGGNKAPFTANSFLVITGPSGCYG